MLTLYADVLLAINFSMDFLALFICSMILHIKTTRKRIILASLLGGLFGVLEVILPINNLVSVLITLLVSFLMCVVAYKNSTKKRLFTAYLMFWGVSAALGGVMSLTYSSLNVLFQDVIAKYSPSGAYNGARFLIISSITAIISIIFSRFFTSKKDVKSTEILVVIDNAEYRIDALCDSGNMLSDPILSKPVILVVKRSKLGMKILSKNDNRKRIIPYSDVSGGGILKGIIPETVIVGGNSVDAIVAPVEVNDFSGYEALVPARIV